MRFIFVFLFAISSTASFAAPKSTRLNCMLGANPINYPFGGAMDGFPEKNVDIREGEEVTLFEEAGYSYSVKFELPVTKLGGGGPFCKYWNQFTLKVSKDGVLQASAVATLAGETASEADLNVAEPAAGFACALMSDIQFECSAH